MKGLIEQHAFDFSNVLNASRDWEASIFNYTEQIFSQIVKKQDEYLKQQLINYAKDYANKKQENVKLWLLDEDVVRLIIDLGIQEYIRRYQNG